MWLLISDIEKIVSENRTQLSEIQIMVFWISECHILNIWKSYSPSLNYDLCKVFKLIIYLLSINENFKFYLYNIHFIIIFLNDYIYN